jgi:hypothetical protein
MLSAPFDAGQCGERGVFPLYWFSDILHAQSSEYPACPELRIFFSDAFPYSRLWYLAICVSFIFPSNDLVN